MTPSFATNGLLGPAIFPSLENGIADSDQSIGKMQQDDPLATQIWKFFAKTKQQLPNQHRMENLTWRMMSLNMRKEKQKQQEIEERKKKAVEANNRYASVAFIPCCH